MVSVIFPAAGQGRRMGLGFNKIFTELAGKPILIQTLLTFSRCDCIDELVIAVDVNEMDIIKKVLSRMPGLKPYKIVAGGSERQYSVYNGLMAVSPEADIVLVHDAARPLISERVIQNVVDEVMLSGSAVCAVPVKDTTAVIDEMGFIEKVPDRDKLWAIQTPQGFRKEILAQAHQKAQEDDFLGTDEASIVRRTGRSVKLVMGDYDNIKITTPTDLFMAEMLFSHKAAKHVKIKMSSLISDILGKVQK
ncbi:2-C-methyl-D-erythritol 4-phosphate cytidylyltransferase [Megamonas hypermegale]|uniref:2-C-methyl-D-erythritol 4-phosphate cytidylyltransferase n=1 Tax=Megamonas hypermegale TaxID=158847 RepID=UPI0026EF3ABE|nr:2-C-methyl-D-erythritol 4-phosphate cytidylyltransferase [Megamonas hypermegale]